MSRREFERFRCVLMRGGTSKAVFFNENELPRDRTLRDRIILSVFGSPDPRQIDGLGGADSLTSKLAIIGPPSRPDADVDYTFGQVAVAQSFVDYFGNCGNISSAVGPYAIEEGFVRAAEPITHVRIHNTNTKKLYVAEVPTLDGRPRVLGNFTIAGVPRSGAEIVLDMSGTAGTVNGNLLPTGNVTDRITVRGLGEIAVSLVDVANPLIFVRASDLGMTGTETAAEIDKNPKTLQVLETIRGIGAEMIGLAKSAATALEDSPGMPMVACVAPPRDYRDGITGATVKADSFDLLSRMMWMQTTHKTYSATAAVATGSAAAIPGTVVNEAVGGRPVGGVLKIGHPGGIIPVDVRAETVDGRPVITRAAFSRTARRLMEGYVYVPGDVATA